MKIKNWPYLMFFLWAALLLIGGQIWSGDAETIALSRQNQPPSGYALLGTDQLGRDVLAGTLVGGSISLLIGLGAAMLAITIGTFVGLVAGYYGGIIDQVLMRLLDALKAIPTLILLIFWQTLSKPSGGNVVAVIGAVSWLQTARIVRSEVLSLKEREFIAAAKAIACPEHLILLRHILPYCAGRLNVLFMLAFSGAVLMESTLSFLGLGLPAHIPSLGNMLSNSLKALNGGYWWQILFPGITLVISIGLLNACGARFSKEDELNRCRC